MTKVGNERIEGKGSKNRKDKAHSTDEVQRTVCNFDRGGVDEVEQGGGVREELSHVSEVEVVKSQPAITCSYVM
jgi:hypothetical protein